MKIDSDPIYLALTVGSAIFAIFMFFRKPQEESDVVSARADEKYNALKDIVLNLRDNHIHTLQSDLNQLRKDQQEDTKKVWEKLGEIKGLLEKNNN